MKTKLMYVADDGTSFDSMQECIAYEKSVNKYTVFYKDKDVSGGREFDNEPSAKRYIAECLHECYEDDAVGDFKIIHRGKTIVFNSNELANFVPAHYKINGEKLNEVFQLAVARDVKIPGYTLHGDYYLADKVIPNKTWEEACKMKKPVKLPNGEIVIAGTLSKEELESIPEEQRKINDNSRVWYWTSTPDGDSYAWDVYNNGGFSSNLKVSSSYVNGGARLGFKNPFKS